MPQESYILDWLRADVDVRVIAVDLDFNDDVSLERISHSGDDYTASGSITM